MKYPPRPGRSAIRVRDTGPNFMWDLSSVARSRVRQRASRICPSCAVAPLAARNGQPSAGSSTERLDFHFTRWLCCSDKLA